MWISYAENIWYSVDVNAAQAKWINTDQVKFCRHIPYYVQVERKLCDINLPTNAEVAEIVNDSYSNANEGEDSSEC